MLDKKLEEKREIFSNRLKILKLEYCNIIENSDLVDPLIVRNSLLGQIEVLMELINTTKLKITLIQQFEIDVSN